MRLVRLVLITLLQLKSQIQAIQPQQIRVYKQQKKQV